MLCFLFVSLSDEKDKFKFSEHLALDIVENMLSDTSSMNTLHRAINYFLFSCNASECRWLMHAIIRAIFEWFLHMYYNGNLFLKLICLQKQSGPTKETGAFARNVAKFVAGNEQVWSESGPVCRSSRILHGKIVAHRTGAYNFCHFKWLYLKLCISHMYKFSDASTVDESPSSSENTKRSFNRTSKFLYLQVHTYIFWNISDMYEFWDFLCSSLSTMLEFDGYYLESSPCLVCNNPEVPFTVFHHCSLLMFIQISLETYNIFTRRTSSWTR